MSLAITRDIYPVSSLIFILHITPPQHGALCIVHIYLCKGYERIILVQCHRQHRGSQELSYNAILRADGQSDSIGQTEQRALKNHHVMPSTG